jgi:hypothetical protein
VSRLPFEDFLMRSHRGMVPAMDGPHSSAGCFLLPS